MSDLIDAVKLKAGCHCGAVRFAVTAPADTELVRCNCSICAMSGFVHLFVGRGDVVFEQGEDALKLYQFGTKTAQHLFCPTCGVKPLYVPRSHPDGWSVNANCIDDRDVFRTLTHKAFDGQNWEDNIDSLR